VTRSTKMMIPALLAVAAIAGFWFLVLAPKRDEIAKLDTDIAAQQTAADTAEAQAAGYEKAKANYRENYTMVARLGKAVTADDDVRSLIVQLDETAKRSKVQFKLLNVAGGGGEASAKSTTKNGLAPPPGTVPVGSAGFSSMPFTFAFTGDYFHLSNFFRRLERFVTVENERIDVTGRLLLLGNITVAPDGETGNLKAQIGAATYLVPPTEGVAGAPTPAPAAGGASGAAPASGGSGVPNTTATITGVR
jgi:Tfp pilus assembly protein PilO